MNDVFWLVAIAVLFAVIAAQWAVICGLWARLAARVPVSFGNSTWDTMRMGCVDLTTVDHHGFGRVPEEMSPLTCFIHNDADCAVCREKFERECC